MTCRPALPSDEMFIVSGWSSSYRKSRDIAFVQMSHYADAMHPIVRSVLARPAVRVMVAHGDEMLHGFIAYEHSKIGLSPLVHYIYVAQPYRRRGFARDLFEAAGIDPDRPFEYACRTEASWRLIVVEKKAPESRYNPYRARYAEEKENRRV